MTIMQRQMARAVLCIGIFAAVTIIGTSLLIGAMY